MKLIKNILKKFHIIYFLSIFFYIFRIFKIQNSKIVCINFNGKGYGDNPKYIVKQLTERNNNYKIIWIVDKNTCKKDFPNYIETVKKYSLKYFYHLSTAKIWINNNRFSVFVKKRKKQFYIQTWHGSLPIKRIEYDAEDKLPKYYKQVMKNDNKMIDCIISNSDFSTQLYKRNFIGNIEILEYGIPRNDLFFTNLEAVKIKVCKYYNIKCNTKIILYAPTFRNNYTNKTYNINLKKIKEILSKNGEEWEIIIRFHPGVKNLGDNMIMTEEYINATEYSDMQELIGACDLFITDYSSTMFEAMIANKAVILYMTDIEEYKQERGYYFELDELPFKQVCNNEELIKVIQNNSLENLSEKYDDFRKKINLKEDGKASSRVAKMIKQIVYK